MMTSGTMEVLIFILFFWNIGLSLALLNTIIAGQKVCDAVERQFEVDRLATGDHITMKKEIASQGKQIKLIFSRLQKLERGGKE